MFILNIIMNIHWFRVNKSFLTFICQDAPRFSMIHVLEIIKTNGYLTLVTTVLHADAQCALAGWFTSAV